jgi:MSHA pilin protein MshA
MPRRHGFTLIELIAVVIILAVLSAVALPKYFNYSDQARNSADEGSLGGITTALQLAYLDHRQSNAPAGQWITDTNDIAAAMQTGQLPEGVTIDAGQLVDQRGNRYDFTAETISTAARIELDSGGGGS